MQERGGTNMANDVMEVEDKLRNVVQEKRQLVEQFGALQQYIGDDESWLTMITPQRVGYQETLKELLALQAYLEELHAQAVALDDVMLELTLEQELWDNPDLLLAS
jgi:hypothetical protein